MGRRRRVRHHRVADHRRRIPVTVLPSAGQRPGIRRVHENLTRPQRRVRRDLPRFCRVGVPGPGRPRHRALHERRRDTLLQLDRPERGGLLEFPADVRDQKPGHRRLGRRGPDLPQRRQGGLAEQRLGHVRPDARPFVVQTRLQGHQLPNILRARPLALGRYGLRKRRPSLPFILRSIKSHGPLNVHNITC